MEAESKQPFKTPPPPSAKVDSEKADGQCLPTPLKVLFALLGLVAVAIFCCAVVMGAIMAKEYRESAGKAYLDPLLMVGVGAGIIAGLIIGFFVFAFMISMNIALLGTRMLVIAVLCSVTACVGLGSGAASRASAISRTFGITLGCLGAGAAVLLGIIYAVSKQQIFSQ
jgi:hypothetical protein